MVTTEPLALTDVGELHTALAERRRVGQRVALVPTMGNLHEGHLQLIRRARQAADFVAVSIFVNPLQFSPGEDYVGYPRTLDRDRERLAGEGADLVFAPEVSAVYPRPLSKTTRVEVPDLGDILCGADRPGHFTGVATVVNILFNLFQPQVAIFGQKDYQQLLVIRRMVEDLRMPVEILSMPTVREQDGLAMSSRNVYLTPAERRRAPLLYEALCDAREQVMSGNTDFPGLEESARERLDEAGLRPDYFTVRRADDLGEPEPDHPGLVFLAAARLGRARLIDNVLALSGR